MLAYLYNEPFSSSDSNMTPVSSISEDISSTKLKVSPPNAQVVLEVCSAAVEARDFISTVDDHHRHEARIVRVENTTNIVKPPSSSVVNGCDIQPSTKRPIVIVKKANGLILSTTTLIHRKTIVSDDSPIKINVNECQTRVEQLLTSENSNDGLSVGNKQNGDHDKFGSKRIIGNGPSIKVDAQPDAKRRRIIVPTSRIDDEPQPSTSSTDGPQYMCEWNGCGRYCNEMDLMNNSSRLFSRPTAVFYHVSNAHIDDDQQPTQLCRWPHCDSTIRAKWSLITHVQVYGTCILLPGIL